VQIYTYATSPYDEWHQQASAAALVLVAMVLILKPGRAAALSRAGPAVAVMSDKMQAEALRCWFGKSPALKGVSMPVVAEKVTAIIGPRAAASRPSSAA
jgi:hypothetical protein